MEDMAKKITESVKTEEVEKEGISRGNAIKKIGIGLAGTSMLLLLQSKAKAQGSVYPDPFSNF